MTQNTFVFFNSYRKVFVRGVQEYPVNSISSTSINITEAIQFKDLKEASEFAELYYLVDTDFKILSYQSALDFITPKLYIVFLGGNLPPKRFGEDHEIVTVVANSQEEAKKRAKSKWTGYGKAHIDGIMQVDIVDGYKVKLEQTAELDKLKLETNWGKLN